MRATDIGVNFENADTVWQQEEGLCPFSQMVDT